MKKYIIQLATAFSFVALTIVNSGCAKISDFGDTNVSPNGIAQPLTSALLTNTLVALPGLVMTPQPPSMFCQYQAESTYPGVSKYTGLQINSVGNYTGSLMDCQVIINWNSDPKLMAKASQFGDNANQKAIAMILKTFIMWTTTDKWGDMPYSEALQGAAILLPKYDEQQAIYTAMLKDLVDANAAFNPTGATVQGDIVYAGDVAKWRKFSNSLRMLIALRMTKRYPTLGGFAATEFFNAATSPYGFISTNADNFTLNYPGGNYQNPYNALSVSQDIAVALTFTDALNNMTDARVNGMSTLPNGCPYGLANAAPLAIPYGRTLNTAFNQTNSPLVVLNAASVLLAQAEAIERGWFPLLTTADANIAYDAAITQSFAQWGQTLPATFLTTGPANYLTGGGAGGIGGTSVAGSNAITTTKLQRIWLQQWIAFYPSGTQGWSNWRRTGFPDLRPTIFATNPGGKIPRRYTYGTSEYSTNAAQLAIAIAKLTGGDTQDAYIWWDKP